MRHWWIGLMLCAAAASAEAQQRAFVVRRGGAEIGRERLLQRPGTERAPDGTSTAVESTYGGTAVSALAQRAADGTMVLFRLRVSGDASATILAATNGGRLAVRREMSGAESARELPARPDMLLLDEQAWTLLQTVADAATPAGAPLRLLFPRLDRTYRVTATRIGTRVTLAGDLAGTIDLDRDGRLARVALPSLALEIMPQVD